MKKTFGENRLVAWVVFAACVLFSLSFSGGRALANLRGETEQIFYQGVYGDGLCIDRDLEEIARCTQQMAELAQGYEGTGDGLAEAALEASQQLSQAQSIADKYPAYMACRDAASALYSSLSSLDLSPADESEAYQLHKEILSRVNTISRDFYNDRAAQFNETLSAFPADLVGGLSGVKPLELFGED